MTHETPSVKLILKYNNENVSCTFHLIESDNNQPTIYEVFIQEPQNFCGRFMFKEHKWQYNKPGENPFGNNETNNDKEGKPVYIVEKELADQIVLYLNDPKNSVV